MPFSNSRTPLLASAASVVLALTLAGCGSPSSTASPTAPSTASPSASATASASATPSVSIKPTNTIDGISVTGAFGKEPAIAFTSPMAIDETRSKVLVAGKGAVVAADGYVDVNYQGVNMRTGKTFDDSFTRGKSAQFSLNGVVAGFKKGLQGKHVGDRVLVAMPGTDGYDSNNGSSDGSIAVGDSLVFVVDILDTSYDKPFGTAVAPKAGLPTVTVDAQGIPSVAINTTATPPTAPVVQPLIAGQGNHKILATDAIMVKYRQYSWKTGKLLTDMYATTDSGALSGTIGCWKDGLPGQTLGSRLLLVCPPSTAYPNGNATPKIDSDDTLVFVIDLVFAGAGS